MKGQSRSSSTPTKRSSSGRRSKTAEKWTKAAALRDLKHAREAGSTLAELDDFVKANPKLAPLADTPEFRKLVGTTSQ